MLKDLLLSLRMYGAVEALNTGILSSIERKEEYVQKILEVEWQYRERKQEARRLKAAVFPSDKDWNEIDKTINPEIDFEAVKALNDGEFILKKENLCIVGHQGTGKTLSLIALGRDLCRKGFSVKFCTAHDLVASLEEAQDESRLSKLISSLLKPSLLIIDELGFVPFTKKGANLLFEVFAKRYERGSIAVSTNLAFDKWSTLFRSMEMTAALLDRFTHRAHIFVYKGDSARLHASKQRAALQTINRQ